ncbi:MAG: cytidylate kinase-like family protein [Thermoanaerobaculaceae bacterium]|jgi:cytidylate kinase|nr:cytidylate kinase-like family protein [Thermoanaerobaculaceae bacterium]
MVSSHTHWSAAVPADHLIDRHAHWGELRQRLSDVTGGAGAGVQPRPFVAISRQAGAGGEAVARALGSRLGWQVLDRELLDFLSEQVEEDPRTLALLDETATSWFDQSLFILLRPHLVSQDEYVARLVKIVLLSVTRRPLVVVGRGAHVFMPPQWGLTVRIVAPLAERVQAVRDELGLDTRAAERWISTTDRARLEFVRRHFRQDAADPASYDLVLNPARLGVEGTVDTIEAAARARGLLGDPPPGTMGGDDSRRKS